MSAATPPEPASAPETFGPEAFAAVTGAGPAVMADLHRFRDLLGAWNARMNLVGPSAMASFWLRHAWDSAQLLDHAPSARIWADLGAGAGFPGVILAILLKGRADVRVHLVESMAKRCLFLSEAARALDLPVEIHNRRAEDVSLPGIEVVTARAVAPMAKLLGFASPLLAGKRPDQTIGLFLKGTSAAEELTEARQMWDFDAELLPSRSDPSGRIVRIERLRRARSR